MEADIKRVVLEQLPELAARLHLPQFARVVAMHTPSNGELQTQAVPHYSVDVLLLDENFNPVDERLIFEALPLPANTQLEPVSGGMLVELAFAYGRADRPFIRTILNDNFSLPKQNAGDAIQQSCPNASDGTKANGDMWRETTEKINDTCAQYGLSASEGELLFNELLLVVNGHSVETVGGMKLIKALGALKLLSAGHVNISAGDGLNLTTASNFSTRVAGDVQESCAKTAKRIAKLAHHFEVGNGGTFYLGDGSTNILSLLSEVMAEVKALADAVAAHKHIYTDTVNGTPNPAAETQVPDNAADASTVSTNVDTQKTSFDNFLP